MLSQKRQNPILVFIPVSFKVNHNFKILNSEIGESRGRWNNLIYKANVFLDLSLAWKCITGKVHININKTNLNVFLLKLRVDISRLYWTLKKFYDLLFINISHKITLSGANKISRKPGVFFRCDYNLLWNCGIMLKHIKKYIRNILPHNLLSSSLKKSFQINCPWPMHFLFNIAKYFA